MTSFDAMINDHLACIRDLAASREVISAAAEALSRVTQNKGRIFICGNGGSAADAQHFAAELVGRFERERRALPALALTTDTSILTAVANDYGYESVFVRQLAGLAAGGDALIGLSTSGNSENVLRALRLAAETGLTRVVLTGGDGGCLKDEADYAIVVPSANTARVQEAHILILHYWAQVIETGNSGG
ncbi:MAG: SIS domain-containing protein [Desulfosudaceae bacterium]